MPYLETEEAHATHGQIPDYFVLHRADVTRETSTQFESFLVNDQIRRRG